jgi:DNA-directed RNA polymerase subunit RPC12/RpoP
MINDLTTKSQKVPNTCPHCGKKLTPWQQVLIATDRALVCKGCWYRIILDINPDSKKSASEKPKDEELK